MPENITEKYITRKGEVDGQSIVVYDGLVPQLAIDNLTSALEQNAFTHNEIARPETAQFKHWAVNLTLDEAEKLPIFKPTIDATVPFCVDGSKYRIYRAYCNFASYGDMLFTHTDAMPGSKELTALWFMAKEWNLEWGGETLFFNKDEDAEFVASPRPGRLILFDGSISHVGRPPNRICFAPRFTFAFKLEAY